MRRVVAALALATAAAVPGVVAAAATNVPSKDSFTASISHATGDFHGTHGAVSIAIHVKASTASVRHATLVLDGKACGRKAHCIRLDGRLTGTLRAGPQQNPDAGREVDFSGHGKVSPLGTADAGGVIHGTGFIARGRESISLTLRNSRGTVTVTGQSGLVRGFTSP